MTAVIFLPAWMLSLRFRRTGHNYKVDAAILTPPLFGVITGDRMILGIARDRNPLWIEAVFADQHVNDFEGTRRRKVPIRPVARIVDRDIVGVALHPHLEVMRV